jgi:DNA invertase Pin-like site-specific DNA recombinase
VSVYGYTRVSTDEQGRSGLGLAAQRTTIEQYAAARSWPRVEVHEEVASGARDNRPVLGALLASVRPGDTLVVARLDRLTRSLLQFATVVEVARGSGWSLVVVDQGFDLGTPAGRAMAGMFAVFASYERELIGQRTSLALRALPRERRNGRPVYSEAVRGRARELRSAGASFRLIAATLMEEGVAPARGGRALHPSTISRLIHETP